MNIALTSSTCLICKAPISVAFADLRVDGETDSFSILKCENCGLGVLSPFPDDLGKHYEGYHGRRHGFTAKYRARRRVARLNSVSRSNRKGSHLLDVGYGDGAFLREAKRNGWNCVGTERKTVEDLPFQQYTDLDSIKISDPDLEFDAITCWHTLEHFERPDEVLSSIYDLLAEDGVLLIAVPNFGGQQARFFGKDWLHLDVPRHLFHFTWESLEKLLNANGFDVVQTWHHESEYDIMGWAQSALNKLFSQPNVFFHALSGKALDTGKPALIANYVLGSIFSLLSIPLVILGIWKGQGGTIIVSARKSEVK